MFDLSLEKVRFAVVQLIALVLSIAVHEFGHAIAADRLGDGTPRHQGRVTLNPLVHADPIGTLLFPLVGLLAGGFIFGWGRPVMVNPLAFTRKLRMKISHMLVAAAGPAMNVLLATLLTILLAVLAGTGVLSPAHPIFAGIYSAIVLNWILAFFNLIPCPPLDGGAVLAGLLPDRHSNVIDFLNQYGLVILILLLISGLIGYLLAPAIWIAKATTGLALDVAL